MDANKVAVTVSIESQTLDDLLCNALEGGSNYWYMISDWDKAGREFLHEGPMAGGWLKFVGEEINGRTEWKLDRDGMLRGFAVMVDKYPRHAANALSETECDAETGDVFLQCCLFGELIYG